MYTPPSVVGVSQNLDEGLALAVREVAWNLRRAAEELLEEEQGVRMGGKGASVAEICGAWLAGRITAEEAMEAIALHPEVVVKVLKPL